jgi:hypothetical protein
VGGGGTPARGSGICSGGLLREEEAGAGAEARGDVMSWVRLGVADVVHRRVSPRKLDRVRNC